MDEKEIDVLRETLLDVLCDMIDEFEHDITEELLNQIDSIQSSVTKTLNESLNEIVQAAIKKSSAAKKNERPEPKTLDEFYAQFKPRWAQDGG